MEKLYFFCTLCVVCICAGCEKPVICPLTPIDQSSSKRTEVILDNGDKRITYKNGLTVIEQKSGKYLFQGDMILTAEQVEFWANPSVSKGAHDFDFSYKRWDNLIVPYVITSSFTPTSALENAIAHIEAMTNLRFIPHSSERDYIEFYKSTTGNNSKLGRVGGAQSINILNINNTGVIVHEICHALGMIHEHCRNDRANYINVNYDNIDDDFEDQFWIVRLSECLTPFDYGSIMMYDGYSFSHNDRPTITKLSDGQPTVGQRTALSSGDISALAQMYPNPKYGTSGPQLVEPGARGVTYHINGLAPDLGRVASVQWSTSSTFPATITSGQGTPQITVDFPSQFGTHDINATIVFRNGDRRAMPPRMVGCTAMPIVNAIRYSKYFQEDGEYTLYADMANDLTVSTQWQCSSNASFHELPYPDDGSFALHPNLYTAIDFYQPGPHQITVFATNASGTAIYTETIYVYDTKTTAFPMRLTPNPATQGQSVSFEMASEQPMRNAVTEPYQIELRNAQNELVLTAHTPTAGTMLLQTLTLPKGKYQVAATHQTTTKRHVSVLEIK